MDEIEKRIGRNVAVHRNAAGLSQAELARRLSDAGTKFTQQMVARIETGVRPLRLSEYEALRKVLDLPGFGSSLDVETHDREARVNAEISRLLSANKARVDDLRAAAKALGETLVDSALLFVAIAPVDISSDYRLEQLAHDIEDDYGSLVHLALLQAFNAKLAEGHEWDYPEDVPSDATTPASVVERVRRGDSFRAVLDDGPAS